MGFTERLAVIIDSTLNAAGFKEGATASGELEQKGGLANSAMQKLGISGGSTGQVLKYAVAGGAIAAGAAISKFALDGVNHVAALTGEVKSFQRTTGATAQDASKLVNVSDRLGVSSDATASGMFRMGRQIADGKSHLADYGIEVAKNADGTTNLTATLGNASEAFSKTTDPAARAQMAFDLFGKSGATMIPILTQGKASLEAMYARADAHHQVFTQDEIDKATAYKISIANLSESWHGLQEELGMALMPVLTEVANTMTGAVAGIDKVSGAVANLPSPVKNTALTFGELTLGIGAAVKGAGLAHDVFDKLKTKTDGLGLSLGSGALAVAGFTAVVGAAAYGIQSHSADVAENKAQIEGLAQAYNKAGDGTDKFTVGVKAMEAAKRALESGKPLPDSVGSDAVWLVKAGILDKVKERAKALKDEMSSSQAVDQKVNDAQLKYNDLLATGAASSDQLVAAKRELTSASTSQKTREDTVAAAMKTEDQVAQDTAKSLKALADVKSGAADSDIAVRSAQLGVTTALTDYATKLKDAKTSTTDLATSQLAAEVAMENTSKAIADQAQKHAQLKGAAYTATDAINAQIWSLKLQESSLAPDSKLRQGIDTYIATLTTQIPKTIDTKVTADTTAAQKTIDDFKRQVAQVKVQIPVTISGLTGFGGTATGGR